MQYGAAGRLVLNDSCKKRCPGYSSTGESTVNIEPFSHLGVVFNNNRSVQTHHEDYNIFYQRKHFISVSIRLNVNIIFFVFHN